MKKRILFLILPLLSLFTACAPQKEQKEQKIFVLSTIAQIDDLVADIGKEKIAHGCLIKGGLDPHIYELVKGDDESFQRAALVFYNGLGLEHGHTLHHQLEKHPQAVALGNLILKKNPSTVITVEDTYDPHIWMDIHLWMELIDPIVEHLTQLLPECATFFTANGEALKEKMRLADLAAYKSLQEIPENKRHLVTSHNAFNYFVRRYLALQTELQGELWAERVRAPEGLAPEAELSICDLQKVMEYIEKKQVCVLFPESNVNRDALKKLVQVGASKGLDLQLSTKALYADAMGQGISYLEMMDYNVKTIKEALTPEEK